MPATNAVQRKHAVVTPTRRVAPTVRAEKPSIEGKPPDLGQDRLVLGRDIPPAPPVVSVEPASPPDPPIVKSPEQALEMALRGEAVRFPSVQGEPNLLVIKPTGIVSGLAGYDVSLGKDHLQLRVPETRANSTEFLLQGLKLLYHVPDQYKTAIKSLQINQADDFAVGIVDPSSHDETIAIRKTGVNEGAGTVNYRLAMGEFHFDLVSPAQNDLSLELAQAVHLYLAIPPHLRYAFKAFNIDNGANPTDAYWAKQYNIKDFTSAATGGNGVTNFWHGTSYFTDGYFFHEFGHVLGQGFSTKGQLFPDGWEALIAADGAAVTDYGKSSPSEDFAESWMEYTRCKRGLPATETGEAATEDEFRKRFPNRTRLLDAIYSGDLKATNR